MSGLFGYQGGVGGGGAGTPGADGATWLNGAIDPAANIGSNNDYYINTASYDIFQKQSGAWAKIGNLKGAAGATGPGVPVGGTTGQFLSKKSNNDYDTQWVAAPTGGGVASKNYLINGDFSINQRVFAGGALAANKYGHDRWKADTGGTNYTVSGKTVTLVSGSIVQVIEAPDLAGEIVTVSVENPSGNITVNVEDVTGTITAGSGRRGATLTVPTSSTGNITLKLSGTNVSFSKVQLEKGSASTGFEYRPIAQERMLCQRYYENSYQDGVAPGTATTSGSVTTFIQTAYWPVYPMVTFQTAKAKEPSITLYCPNTSFGAGYSEYDISDTFVADKSLSAGGVSTKSFYVINASGNSTPGNIIRFHWVADAEF